VSRRPTSTTSPGATCKGSRSEDSCDLTALTLAIAAEAISMPMSGTDLCG
jgi:hypothetical protein